MTTKTEKGPLLVCQLREEDGSVVVCPQDGDRFVIQKRKAVEALKAVDRQASFEAQLQVLLNALGAWAKQRTTDVGDISSMYLTLGDIGFLAIVVKRDADYSRDLEDSLSELDLEIANNADLDTLRVEFLAVPNVGPVALDSFLHNGFQLQLSCEQAPPQAS